MTDDIASLEVLAPIAYKNLTDSGFLISDDTDELYIVREKHKEAVHSRDYMLIVLPTLNCNYKCWYCIQDHVPSVMSDKVIKSIQNHIDYMIHERNITSLHLEWFGGEPLMFFERVIVPINQYAIKKCNEYGIPFTSSSTTNGYFLTSSISSKCGDLSFRNFQITLDGDREFHDKVKYMNGCASTFDHVLTNINNILSENNDVTVCLRINYTHATLSERIVEEVSQHIESRNRERVIITPRKVWQEKADKAFPNILLGILDKFASNGFRVSRGDLYPKFIPCYVNREYYNAINFNGHVVKCTACNDLYETDPKGRLMEDGTIQWRDDYDLRCQEATFENERCLACKKLPLCMGLCPRDYLAGYSRCKYDTEDRDLEQSIFDFLIHEYEA